MPERGARPIHFVPQFASDILLLRLHESPPGWSPARPFTFLGSDLGSVLWNWGLEIATSFFINATTAKFTAHPVGQHRNWPFSTESRGFYPFCPYSNVRDTTASLRRRIGGNYSCIAQRTVGLPPLAYWIRHALLSQDYLSEDSLSRWHVASRRWYLPRNLCRSHAISDIYCCGDRTILPLRI